MLLGARMLQGAANAFTTPLLLAALAALTPKDRLGRALGLFGALQAAGLTFAPLVGGIAAEIDWRWAFVVLAAAALALACVGLPDTPESDADSPAGRARLRDALRPRIVRIGIVALLGWGAIGGINFLLAFRAEDVFDLDPSQRGALLTVLGVAGILTARRVGILVDRIGARRTVLIGALSGAALVVTIGTVTNLAVVAVAWFLAGIASQCVLVGVNAAVLGDPGAQPRRCGVGGAGLPLRRWRLRSARPHARCTRRIRPRRSSFPRRCSPSSPRSRSPHHPDLTVPARTG